MDDLFIHDIYLLLNKCHLPAKIRTAAHRIPALLSAAFKNTEPPWRDAPFHKSDPASKKLCMMSPTTGNIIHSPY